MVSVQPIVACWSLFAFPVRHCDYDHNANLGSPESSQYTTHYALYQLISDARLVFCRRDFHWWSLVRFSNQGNEILTAAKLLKA